MSKRHCEDAELVEAIEQGLPLVARPYAALAESLGCSEQQVIDGIRRLQAERHLKRFGVVVRHRKLGYTSNGMVVWNIADAEIDRVAHYFTTLPWVTLCYRRRRQLPDWPYNLFSMVHGKSRDEVRAKVELMSEGAQLSNNDHDVLFSTRCFKQTGARYSCDPIRLAALKIKQVG